MPYTTRWSAACCVLFLQATLAAQDLGPQSLLSQDESAIRRPGVVGEFADPLASSAPSDREGPRDDASELDPWSFRLLPDGLIYRSYLAGGKEPRFASQWVYERDQGWLWDLTAGGASA